MTPLDKVTKLLNVIQMIVIVAGLPIAIGGLFYTAIQTKTQVTALNDSRKVESAKFVLDASNTLSNGDYGDILTAIEGTDKPHSSSYPILKKSGGNFNSIDIDDYLGLYNDVGVLYQENLVDETMAYDEFSYDVEKAYCNKDVSSEVMRLRQLSNQPDNSLSYYKPFEILANRFLQIDGYTCANLDSQ